MGQSGAESAPNVSGLIKTYECRTKLTLLPHARCTMLLSSSHANAQVPLLHLEHFLSQHSHFRPQPAERYSSIRVAVGSAGLGGITTYERGSERWRTSRLSGTRVFGRSGRRKLTSLRLKWARLRPRSKCTRLRPPMRGSPGEHVTLDKPDPLTTTWRAAPNPLQVKVSPP